MPMQTWFPHAVPSPNTIQTLPTVVFNEPKPNALASQPNSNGTYVDFKTPINNTPNSKARSEDYISVFNKDLIFSPTPALESGL